MCLTRVVADNLGSYYINPPGTGCKEACVWGTKDSPVGNWSPYVAGANVNDNGESFIKLGWNPIYLEEATPFKNEMPNWGVKIECDGAGCKQQLLGRSITIQLCTHSHVLTS